MNEPSNFAGSRLRLASAPPKDVNSMLVLTRKIGEIVTIGDDVRVTVLSIEGDRVRLGIDAPSEVRIERETSTGEEGPSSSTRA